MEIFSNILVGFSVASTVSNLSWCLLGVILGTVVGILPAFGTMAAISMMLPVTYIMPSPTTIIIFISGVYYGTQYGGSITAILMNIPGEVSSTVTTIDGHQMAKNGRAGAALSITAMASFFAGTLATIFIAVLAEPLAKAALYFGPAEYSALMLLGVLTASGISSGSFTKGLAMMLLGFLIGMVGDDVNSGVPRFNFGIPELRSGISFAIIAMGIFGFGEIIYYFLHINKESKFILPSKFNLYPTRTEIKKSCLPTLRGTLLGSLLGLLPGGGTVLSSFASYILEKKISKKPKKFGRGEIAGVAAPEAANNAGAQTSFIPMLSLGLPTTPVMALFLAILITHGITPGPEVVTKNPDLFWALIASMWIGNLFLLILNLPLVGIWVKILTIPYKLLYSIIIVLCLTGAYFINHSWFDVLMLLPFSILGYIFKLLDCEPAPLAMGFIIGSLFEEYLRRTLTISQGDWTIFLQKPMSLFLIIASLVIIFSSIYSKKSQIR